MKRPFAVLSKTGYGLVVVFISLMMGCTSPPKNIDWQGHRGARGERPENTIPAFKYALEAGMSTLEMDVVITSDSQVVVSHEPFFNENICSGFPDSTNNIFQLTYAEVLQVDCGSKPHPNFPEQQNERASKPLLSEVIQVAEAYAVELGREKPFYNIEIKSRLEWDNTFHPEVSEYADLVMQVLEKEALKGRYSLQSFDDRTLRYLHNTYPSVPLVLLVEDDNGLDHHLEELGFVPAVYSPYFKLVDRALVEQAHRRGMKVIPWTVNEEKDMQLLQAMGVDGIITDYPSRAHFIVSP